MQCSPSFDSIFSTLFSLQFKRRTPIASIAVPPHGNKYFSLPLNAHADANFHPVINRRRPTLLLAPLISSLASDIIMHSSPLPTHTAELEDSHAVDASTGNLPATLRQGGATNVEELVAKAKKAAASLWLILHAQVG